MIELVSVISKEAVNRQEEILLIKSLCANVDGRHFLVFTVMSDGLFADTAIDIDNIILERGTEQLRLGGEK